MLTPYLSTPARAALAALALATVSTGAYAFPSPVPDPFLGQIVDLQATPPGTWLALPGLGYTQSFQISGFTGPTPTDDVYRYSASFLSYLSDTSGGPVVRTANLTGTNNFVVQFTDRTDPSAGGTFDMILQMASFSGTVDGMSVDVSLANIPTGRVSMTGTTGNFQINYITPFSVTAQYSLNGGDPEPVPGLLADVNGQPAAAPVPATAALAIPGLLAMAGLRRRRAAVAA
ncbi:hypothetical protein [Candidatus Thiodictyon syntrophicum]|jgi:hypothetical protein|uniref:PEP-CTERM sorting domain-containing protein n=1 Tax=Candidatus Thiodictyon syntrophicum TaxID=1166950 RepID=A0A2K8U9N2_9GAMM|nr:hypothetical protein [Candidatus Thiodictyon syntrophicum]AUB82265.1 hypothetical protein THSYN_15790 [Candidatus Thiodictyon syntrophicum]